MDMRRLLSVSFVLAFAIGGSRPAAQSTGFAAKRPVFGGACPTCPWGAMADIVKAALKPHGWDVQVCYSCAGGPREARLVSAKAMATPPQNPTAAALPTPQGPIDFGATSVELLQYDAHPADLGEDDRPGKFQHGDELPSHVSLLHRDDVVHSRPT